jgi:membrane protease subunit HflC
MVIGLLVVILALGAFAYGSGLVYFVPEYNNVVVTRFGEIQYAVVTGFDVRQSVETTGGEDASEIAELKESYPEGKIRSGAGLYFKLPFVEQAHYFDSRILFWEGSSSEISTMDLRTLLINTSARWRIFDVIKFYKALGTEQQALARIGSIINSNIEDFISETRLIEAVRNENLELETEVRRRLEATEEGEGEEVDAAQIRYGRGELISRIQEETSKVLMDQFGVELIDIMFTQLNYSNSVRQSVYERMKAERERIATRYRSEGERIRRKILGEVSKIENEMISGAERQVREIEGRAEQRRIEIEARAYKKNPEFFRFQRSLQAYEEGMEENVTFILSDDNDLLEFVTSPGR